MTRKVKEILKLVAESPHYAYDITRISSRFMCYALYHAKEAGIISKKEKKLASKAIEKYLNKLSKGSRSLHLALENCGIPNTIENRKAIYLDWKNRPKPWKQEENSHDC